MSGGTFDCLEADERDALQREPSIPRSAQPMLATLSHEHFSSEDWIYERKLDGVRCLIQCDGAVRIVSRNGNRLDDTFPELVEAAQRAVRGHSAVLDGEIVAFRGNVSSFAELQQRIGITDPDESRARGVPVFLYVFDVLHLDGYDTTDLPLRARKKLLRAALDWQDPVRFVQHRNRDGEDYLDEACAKGWEGLIAKRADSRYVRKRSRDWLKFKCSAGQELVIGGYTEPKGSRVGFGALLVGYYDDGALRYAGRVGTGFDDELLESLHGKLERLERATAPFEPLPDDAAGDDVHWVTPSLVGEFGFTEWTDAGRLRHPRFLGLRHDKDPEDVVREDARGAD